LGGLPLAIAGDNRLAVVVAGLPSLDASGEDTSDGGGRPDRVFARRGRCVGGVHTLGHLPATQGGLAESTRPRLYDLCRRRLPHHLRRGAVALGPIALPRTAVGPRAAVAAAGVLPSPTTCAFKHRRAFILGDHPRPLGQELALGRVTTRIVAKDQLPVPCFNRLDQQPLMGIVAGKPSG
jgi:hypothetical protein